MKKRISLILVLLAWGAMVLPGGLNGSTRDRYPECAPQAETLLTLLKSLHQQEAQGSGNAPSEEKLKRAEEALFRCLRYYGYSGTDADEIIKRLKEEARR